MIADFSAIDRHKMCEFKCNNLLNVLNVHSEVAKLFVLTWKECVASPYPTYYYAASQYYVRTCGLLLPKELRVLSVCLSVSQAVTLVRPEKTAEAIEMPFGLRTLVGLMNHVWGPDPQWQFWGENGRTIAKYTDTLRSSVQKRLNRSICRLRCGVEWADGCTNSIVFARWGQCSLMGGHIAASWRIRLNHPSMSAMRLMSNYCGHLLPLATPT